MMSKKESSPHTPRVHARRLEHLGDSLPRQRLLKRLLRFAKVYIQSALDIPANQTSIFALTLCE